MREEKERRYGRVHRETVMLRICFVIRRQRGTFASDGTSNIGVFISYVHDPFLHFSTDGTDGSIEISINSPIDI